MKWIFFIIFILSGCSKFIYDLNELKYGAEHGLIVWKKDHEYLNYRMRSECGKNIDDNLSYEEQEKIHSDCLYDKGYRFHPTYGFCDVAKRSYTCKNREKYKN